MLDSDLVGTDRMKRVIAEDNPTLQAYDENAWIDRLDSRSMPMAEAAALFAANRTWMARILRKCTEADFARVGQHTEDGPKSLAKLLVRLCQPPRPPPPLPLRQARGPRRRDHPALLGGDLAEMNPEG